MSAEQEPNPTTDDLRVSYEADPATWNEIIAMADMLIDAYGTAREQRGAIDVDWTCDFLDKRMRLIRMPLDEDNFSYNLRFEAQIANDEGDTEQSYIVFNRKNLRVDGFFGPATDAYKSLDSDTKFEYAEIDLKRYLSSHPGAIND